MHEQTQFVVGWGTLSFINAGLAQSKGRSGLAWRLVSLFLGSTAISFANSRRNIAVSGGQARRDRAKTPTHNRL